MVDNHCGIQEALVHLSGKYRLQGDLSAMTWLRVGGPAEFLVYPRDEEDLVEFLKRCPREVFCFVLGVGSNVLVRDKGIEGIVFRLGKNFAQYRVEDGMLVIGAGFLNVHLSKILIPYKLGGLEFLTGIPGTIGGNIKMNAGAYGAEIKDRLLWVRGITKEGEQKTLTVEDLKYSYRHCGWEEPIIFVEAAFKTFHEDPVILQENIFNIAQRRRMSQPLREKTGGSTFANALDRKAWELIEGVGLRGYKIGDAQFSVKHCNFLINTHQASARDLEALGELARERVFQKYGIFLKWEVQCVGKQ